MNPLISVIVPFFNAEQYLSKCLDSIINQTYHNLQIILVDDGSTDESGLLADRYAVKDNRILVLHKAHAGLVRARKTGVISASGQYVAYADADDWLELDMYEKLLSLAIENEADVVASGRMEEFPEGTRKYSNQVKEGLYEGESRATLYGQMLSLNSENPFGLYPTVWDKLYKRELLMVNQLQVPNELTMWEDVACVYPLLLEAERIFVTSDCFYHYRQQNSSMTRQFDDSIYQHCITIKDYLKCRFSEGKYKSIMLPQLGNFCKHMFDYAIYRELAVDVEGRYERYMFPFAKVKPGSRIVLYGFGRVGKAFFRQLTRCNYCSEIYVVDGFVKESADCDMIYSPDKILDIKYDYIVLAVAELDDANQIKERLSSMGIVKNIIWEID